MRIILLRGINYGFFSEVTSSDDLDIWSENKSKWIDGDLSWAIMNHLFCSISLNFYIWIHPPCIVNHVLAPVYGPSEPLLLLILRKIPQINIIVTNLSWLFFIFKLDISLSLTIYFSGGINLVLAKAPQPLNIQYGKPEKKKKIFKSPLMFWNILIKKLVWKLYLIWLIYLFKKMTKYFSNYLAPNFPRQLSTSSQDTS